MSHVHSTARTLRLLACGLACAVACTVACAGQPLPADAPLRERHIKPEEGFFAAVRVADITPALHLSLYGHGPEGRIATGVRLRLRCQAFVIANANDVVALVPCDLQSTSMALQRSVAKLLRRYGVPIGVDQLFLMATHTHAAPAHYFEADHYSGPFSSMAPGYDENVTNFLAGRIAAAIIEAYGALQPACVGWKQAEVFGLSMNRSYVPFRANTPAWKDEDDALMRSRRVEQTMRDAAHQEPETSSAPKPPTDAHPAPGGLTFGTAETGEQAAVDPSLTLLRVNRRASAEATCDKSTPIGIFAVFGMHPTGAPNTNEVYHGDIFGFAVRAAEGQLSLGTTADPMTRAWASEAAPPAGAPVVVGLANGNDGDVSPVLDQQSMRAARALGSKLGGIIARVAQHEPESGMSATGTLDHRFWDLRFAHAHVSEGSKERLCKDADLGATVAGGAHDGPTRLRLLPEANAGFLPDHDTGCQNPKLSVRIGSSPPPDSYPRHAPLGLIRIADGVLATAPGEMTTMTGERIWKQLDTHLKPLATKHLALVGLTNQYMQYFATHEEYAYQHYEGASTLYGPNTEPFLVSRFGQLADILVSGKGVPNRPTEFDPEELTTRRRWPDIEEIEPIIKDGFEVWRTLREGSLGWEIAIDPLPLTFTSDPEQFAVQVLQRRDHANVLVDDDRGSSIEVREVDGDSWRVRWIPQITECDPRCGQTFQLSVTGRVQLESKLFVLECAALDLQGCQ